MSDATRRLTRAIPMLSAAHPSTTVGVVLDGRPDDLISARVCRQIQPDEPMWTVGRRWTNQGWMRPSIPLGPPEAQAGTLGPPKHLPWIWHADDLQRSKGLHAVSMGWRGHTLPVAQPSAEVRLRKAKSGGYLSDTLTGCPGENTGTQRVQQATFDLPRTPASLGCEASGGTTRKTREQFRSQILPAFHLRIQVLIFWWFGLLNTLRGCGEKNAIRIFFRWAFWTWLWAIRRLSEVKTPSTLSLAPLHRVRHLGVVL